MLAKHSKSFSLIDCISVGVDRMQRNFEPMRKQVETWQKSELTDVLAKVVIYEAFVEGKLEAPKHLKNTHIPFLLIVCDSVDRDEPFTRLASRVEALAVINRHSRVEAGRSSILINSCSQSSAESAACSDPNNFVTALKNADSSCSAIVARSAQPELEFFDGLLGASGVIFLTSRMWKTRTLSGTAIDRPTRSD